MDRSVPVSSRTGVWVSKGKGVGGSRTLTPSPGRRGDEGRTGRGPKRVEVRVGTGTQSRESHRPCPHRDDTLTDGAGRAGVGSHTCHDSPVTSGLGGPRGVDTGPGVRGSAAALTRGATPPEAREMPTATSSPLSERDHPRVSGDLVFRVDEVRQGTRRGPGLHVPDGGPTGASVRDEGPGRI